MSLDSTRFDDIDAAQAAAAKSEHSIHNEYSGRFDAIEKRMLNIELDVEQNTDLTREIHDVLVAAKVGLKVLGGAGTALKWCGMVAAAVVAIYTFVYTITHGGATPK